MNIGELTLAEKKFLLSPNSNGLALYQLVLFELLWTKNLTFKTRPSRDDYSMANAFLQLTNEDTFYEKNLIYLPLFQNFKGLRQMQVSFLLGNSFNAFDSSFKEFTKQYIIKNLQKKHTFIKDNLSYKLFGKIELTKNAQAYKSQLIEETEKIVPEFSDTKKFSKEQTKQMLQKFGSSIFLVDESHLEKLDFPFPVFTALKKGLHYHTSASGEMEEELASHYNVPNVEVWAEAFLEFCAFFED